MLSYSKELRSKLLQHLSPDLLLPQFRHQKHHLAGYCYVVSETLFHLLGGKEVGLKPMYIKHENISHWWVLGPQGQIWDLTAEQFKGPVPYAKSLGKGFLTRNPSKRSQELIKRVSSKLGNL